MCTEVSNWQPVTQNLGVGLSLDIFRIYDFLKKIPTFFGKSFGMLYLSSAPLILQVMKIREIENPGKLKFYIDGNSKTYRFANEVPAKMAVIFSSRN